MNTRTFACIADVNIRAGDNIAITLRDDDLPVARHATTAENWRGVALEDAKQGETVPVFVHDVLNLVRDAYL